MKRISSKIMFIIIGCSIFTACLVGGFSLYQGAAHIKDEANSKLAYMARSYANEFNLTLKKTENYVDSLHSTIIATFDIQAFHNDPAYISTYENELDAIMKNFASKDLEALGIYVTFNPDLTDTIYEVWYQDVMENGVLYRMNT
ncbi:MAG: hypothetical protein MJA31_04705, partial [Clostridia bacterium]|nr:hypothetical protein [Clostridia bacterium]